MGFLTTWQLKSRNPETRRRAAEALGVPGRAANLGLLMGLLDDADAGVRAAAASSLGALGLAGGIAPLARVAADSTRPRDEDAVTVRIAAVGALGRLGPEAVAALSTAVRDRNPRIREAAVVALTAIGGAPVVPALVAALRDDRSGIRQAAAKALGAIGGDEAERALAEALGHKDATTRVAAADALGQVPVGRNVDALAGALADRDKGVRESAVAALGRLGSPAAIEALTAAFEGSDRELRQAAATALREAVWVPADARQRAIRAVLHNDVAAAEAEGAAAVAPLLVALGAADPAVRRGAAEALGAIGDARAVEPLVAALGDQDERVRGAAVRALDRIGPAAAVAVIAGLGAKGALVRAAASDVIAAVGESRIVQALLDALTAEDILGARRAVDALQQLLEHAAARVPAADLERIAAQPDLSGAGSRRPGPMTSAAGDGDEIVCEDLRRVAAQELVRRTQP